MLQEFTRRTTPDTGAPRLAALRAAMAEAGVDAFLVPRDDAHQGEYVAPRDERLAWLTGFTGSAGAAIVTRDRAAVFVDGRYRLQVRDQVDLACFEVIASPRTCPPTGWSPRSPAAAASATTPGSTPPGPRDPERRPSPPARSASSRVANLVDQSGRTSRPPRRAPIVAHPPELAGESSADKRAGSAAASSPATSTPPC